MTNEKNDFTKGSILKKLALFMLPILGALVLQAAYGAVDLLVVGRFGYHLRTFRSFRRKPGTESGHLCSNTVCNGNYSSHCPLSWGKETGTDWFCNWRRNSCFCCNFSCTVRNYGSFCTPISVLMRSTRRHLS